MQVPRDPNINGTYNFTYMLKSSFIHYLRLKCFVWFLWVYRKHDAITTSALHISSLDKLSWKLSFVTHPVYSVYVISFTIAATL